MTYDLRFRSRCDLRFLLKENPKLKEILTTQIFSQQMLDRVSRVLKQLASYSPENLKLRVKITLKELVSWIMELVNNAGKFLKNSGIPFGSGTVPER